MEIIAETNAYFAELDKLCYTEGTKTLEYSWSKCIELKLLKKKNLLKSMCFQCQIKNVPNYTYKRNKYIQIQYIIWPVLFLYPVTTCNY